MIKAKSFKKKTISLKKITKIKMKMMNLNTVSIVDLGLRTKATEIEDLKLKVMRNLMRTIWIWKKRMRRRKKKNREN